MSRKTIRFLWISLACMLILCVGVFALINLFMVQQNTKTLNQVVNTYMEGMSAQLQRHFETLVSLRLGQVEAIVQAIPPPGRSWPKAEPLMVLSILRFTIPREKPW